MKKVINGEIQTNLFTEKKQYVNTNIINIKHIPWRLEGIVSWKIKTSLLANLKTMLLL